MKQELLRKDTLKNFVLLGTVVHTFNMSTWEAEADWPGLHGESGQPEVHGETLSLNNNKKMCFLQRIKAS